MENNKSIDCPVCQKAIASDIIEDHVNKCLFLNSTATNEKPDNQKRLRQEAHLENKFSPPKKFKKSPNPNQPTGSKLSMNWFKNGNKVTLFTLMNN